MNWINLLDTDEKLFSQLNGCYQCLVIDLSTESAKRGLFYKLQIIKLYRRRNKFDAQSRKLCLTM